jgi:hypothetical protein
MSIMAWKELVLRRIFCRARTKPIGLDSNWRYKMKLILIASSLKNESKMILALLGLLFTTTATARPSKVETNSLLRTYIFANAIIEGGIRRINEVDVAIKDDSENLVGTMQTSEGLDSYYYLEAGKYRFCANQTGFDETCVEKDVRDDGSTIQVQIDMELKLKHVFGEAYYECAKTGEQKGGVNLTVRDSAGQVIRKTHSSSESSFTPGSYAFAGLADGEYTITSEFHGLTSTQEITFDANRDGYNFLRLAVFCP